MQPAKPIRLYVLHLNPEARGLVDRYAVMRMLDNGELSPLWGVPKPGAVCTDDTKAAAKAWPYMVFKARPANGPDRFPAFHFAISGYGFNKLNDLANSLATRLGWPVELHKVTGWRSSPEHGEPRQEKRTRREALAILERS